MATALDALMRNFEAVWSEVRQGIDRIPDEHWAVGDIDDLIPGRHVLHIINTEEGYCRDAEAESWNGLAAAFFGRDLDWEGTPADELPGRGDMLRYMEHSRGHVLEWLGEKSDGDLLAEQTCFVWTGPNVLSRCIYVIRHAQGHVQEINAELRRRGLPRLEWALL